MPNTGNGVPTNGDPPGGPEALVSEDLEHALARRATPRARALRLAIVVPIVLVAGAVLLRSAWPLIVSRTPPSILAPTPSVPVAVTSDVSFGTLYLNGRRLHGPPPQMVTLRSGVNTLTLSAPPFPTQSCAVLGPVPDAGGGPAPDSAPSCDVATSTATLGTTSVSSYTISFTVSGDELSPALQADALATVTQALAAQPALKATVPAGEYFATGLDQAGVPIAARAPKPLAASLSLALGVGPGIGSPGDGCPSLLCAGETQDPAQPFPGSAWLVDVPIVLRWRFTTAAGAPVATTAISAPEGLQMALTYRGGHWKIAAGSSGYPSLDPSTVLAACDQAVNLLADVLGSGSGLGAGGCLPSQATPMGGCTLDAQGSDGAAQGHYLYRFGVLLAADAAAHRLAPTLPIAPPAEVAAVAAATAG